ncbi:MAG: hemolysin III family protein [Oceanospirillales bacterium LUC14_002_19_P2]|nr:MAG: hemolysin III family protein [Oceanospirillales bacterium LUC14_002_19_P2]
MSGCQSVRSPYSVAEEIANSLSHGLGMVFGIVALVLLVNEAVALDDTVRVTSFSIYGASMILLFLASTLYHAIPAPGAKRRLKLFDHCAIYLLIAGTYTPFLLVTLEGTFGTVLMAIVWSLAGLGLAFKLVFGHRYRKLSLLTYLGMGWLSLVAIGELVERLPAGGIWLLASGGLVYSLGVVFYVWKRLPFNHAIWHLFVLGGCVCHFLAIYGYVLPLPAM